MSVGLNLRMLRGSGASEYKHHDRGIYRDKVGIMKGIHSPNLSEAPASIIAVSKMWAIYIGIRILLGTSLYECVVR